MARVRACGRVVRACVRARGARGKTVKTGPALLMTKCIRQVWRYPDPASYPDPLRAFHPRSGIADTVRQKMVDIGLCWLVPRCASTGWRHVCSAAAWMSDGRAGRQGRLQTPLVCACFERAAIMGYPSPGHRLGGARSKRLGSGVLQRKPSPRDASVLPAPGPQHAYRRALRGALRRTSRRMGQSVRSTCWLIHTHAHIHAAQQDCAAANDSVRHAWFSNAMP